MATNKNASIRYRTLDKCFRDFRNRYFIDDLICKCEEALESFNFTAGVSRRQIFDDIRFMESEVGWSISLDRKRDRKKIYYRYTDRDFTINEQPLTDEEAQQLQTVILTLSRFRGLPSNEWIDEVISNLEYRFNLNGYNENIISFEQNQSLKGLNFLTPIIDAASNHQSLKVLYHNYKKGGRDIEFVIHPYYVKQYNNRWFLFGLENGQQRISNLALDRVVSVNVLNDLQFIPNRNIDFEHYFDEVVGVTIPKKNVDLQEVILCFTPDRLPYVISKPLHHSQRVINNEKGTVCVTVKPTRELEQQILSFGSDVEVVSPVAFRTQIREKIANSLKKYLSVQDDCIHDSYLCTVKPENGDNIDVKL